MPLDRELIVIGDRILISPDTDKEKTASGLYLPQGVVSRDKVQSGYVAKVGPGYIVPHPDVGEGWDGSSGNEPKYVPLQVKEGDYALFLRRDAIEIDYESKKYLIVSQSAVLTVVRDKFLHP